LRPARPVRAISGRPVWGFEYFYGFVGGDANHVA
jgi:hypothetical protein